MPNASELERQEQEQSSKPDALERVARMAIDAYHKTRMAEQPAEVFVANTIRPWLKQAGIEVHFNG
jgi:uncharacterized protein (DUF362 family)